ncbi:heme-dependent catalase [Trichoderma afarasin]
MATREYMRWNSQGVEKIPEDEADDIQAVVEIFNGLHQAMFQMNGHVMSGTHGRSHGVVKGTFIVPGNLPSHLKQTELFAQAGEYPAVCRYSSALPDPNVDDRIPQPRGFAIKLFGVEGEMFQEGRDSPTQDIEFNSTPILDLANAKTAKEIIALRLKHGADLVGLYKDFDARPDAELHKSQDQIRSTHLESTRQYSQTAYRFGDYIMKYSLVPSSEMQRELYKQTVQSSDTQDVLRHWLRDFHLHNEAEYEFQVQLCENLEDQPIEDASKEWDAEKYPWETVAKLVIPKQDSYNPIRKKFWEDHIVINPWHGLVSLQPLGGSNRLRRVVYPASRAMRKKLNELEPVHLKTIEDFPDA